MPQPDREPFRVLRSRVLALAQPNVDTDQIIPARFLTTTTRKGLGRKLFHDWRFDAAGKPTRPRSIFNAPDSKKRKILVAGENFGCGSSREHAPWALYDFGFRAVISTKIADIFRANALKNGLLAIEVPREMLDRLMGDEEHEATVDLVARKVIAADGASAPFLIESFARQCMMDGVDQLGFLMQREEAIAKFEAAA